MAGVSLVTFCLGLFSAKAFQTASGKTPPPGARHVDKLHDQTDEAKYHVTAERGTGYSTSSPDCWSMPVLSVCILIVSTVQVLTPCGF